MTGMASAAIKAFHALPPSVRKLRGADLLYRVAIGPRTGLATPTSTPNRGLISLPCSSP